MEFFGQRGFRRRGNWGRGVASALEARLILKEKGPGVDTGEGEQWHDCTGFSPGLKERSSFPQMV